MKIYIKFLFVLLALTSCEKDDFERLSDFSKADIFIAARGSDSDSNEIIPLALNDFISIADVSQGITSRTWTLEGNNAFLTNRFRPEDSLNLTPFIDRSLGLINDDSTIHVLFREPGIQTISYRGVFPREVSISPTGRSGADVREAVASVQEGDEWILNVDYQFEILDNLDARAVVSQNDTQIATLNLGQNFNDNDRDSFPVVTVEVGQSLTLESSLSQNIGEPTSIQWLTPGSSPEEKQGESVEVTYSTTGDFLVNIVLNRNGRGQTLREATHTEIIPLLVRVVPSTQPLAPVNNPMVEPNDDIEGSNRISFEVNGVIASIADTAASNFTLTAVNGTFNQPIPVSRVEIDRNNPSGLILILNEPVFNSDILTLSYTGTGIVADSRELENFMDLEVTPVLQNALTDAANPSFEASSTQLGLGFVPRGFSFVNQGGANLIPSLSNPNGSPILSRSTERANDGAASFRFRFEADNLSQLDPGDPTNGGNTIRFFHNTMDADDLEPGDYIVLMDIFISEGTNIPGITATQLFQGPFDSGGPRDTYSIDFAPITRGEWVEVRANFTADAVINNALVIDVQKQAGLTGVQEFFVDNIQYILSEPRP